MTEYQCIYNIERKALSVSNGTSMLNLPDIPGPRAINVIRFFGFDHVTAVCSDDTLTAANQWCAVFLRLTGTEPEMYNADDLLRSHSVLHTE